MTSIYSKSETIEVFNLKLKVGDRVQHTEDGEKGTIKLFFIAHDGTLEIEVDLDDGGTRADSIKCFKKIL